MNGKTTIQVSRDVKAKLDKLKVHPREPYDDVIKKLLERIEEQKGK